MTGFYQETTRKDDAQAFAKCVAVRSAQDPSLQTETPLQRTVVDFSLATEYLKLDLARFSVASFHKTDISNVLIG